ncbi:cytochrome P450 [Cordyceps militaris]|uniref:Cytochrome P450 n=1 Tax=Cordyceps militaris TaxID=73501 RepID=A0A2H4SWP0_CORMI|nr:cytochrome P450 [Cordyceps militaris]
MAVFETFIESLRGYSLTSAVSVVSIVALVLSLVARLHQFHRLRHFDGPLLAGFSRLWLLQTVWGGKAHLIFWDVTSKYGSIARVGPNDLITSDPELVKHMHSVRSAYRRSDWYDGIRFDPNKDNLASLRNEAEHKTLRAKMAAGYSGREIDGLELKVDENILRFMHLLAKYASANQVLDLARKVQYFTLDVISDISFDKPFGFLETDSDIYRYIETTEQAFPLLMLTTVVPFWVKIRASRLLRSAMPSESDRFGLGRIIGIAKAVAAERFGKSPKVQRDMLGSFVSHGLSQSEVESEILLQMYSSARSLFHLVRSLTWQTSVAGSDTTATAIRSTLLYISTSPRIHAKMRQEIDDTPLSDAVVSDETARSMPYLQAVIKEGLRMFPPVAGLMAKEAPAGGHYWKGVFIPGGTHVGVCAWGIFRRQDVWGTDANEFRPERWLDSTPEQLGRMEGTLELIFSHGRWQCLGRPIALMELNKIFVQILRQFDVSIRDPTNPWKVYNCGIFSQRDFYVRLSNRQ